jgi:hypothetical protein
MAGFPQFMVNGMGGAPANPAGGYAMGVPGAMAGNPFMESMLAAVAAQNPGVVANAAASAGIPPPPVSGSDPMGDPMGTLGNFITPSAGTGQAPTTGWDATVVPNTGMDPMQRATDPLAGLAGFKAPGVDTKPIMSGGVSGAQKAPDGATPQNGLQSAQLLQQMIMQMIQGQQGNAGVGTLGTYIGG